MASILIIASRSDIAGGENYLLSVLRHLDRSRFHPVIWLPGKGPFLDALNAQEEETVVEDVDYGWLKPPQKWYPFLHGLRQRVHRLESIIWENNVALVHTNSNMILEGALAARVAGVRHVHLAHLDFQANLPVYERFPMDAASFARLIEDLSTRIIAVSHFVARTHSPPVLPKNIQVIHNGLETEVFKAGEDEARAQPAVALCKELDLAPDTVLIVAAGRLHPDKGFDFYLEAASRVLASAGQVHFLLAGGEEERDYVVRLKQRAATLGVADRFHFLGFRKDIQHVFAGSDVFVLSSRREGHPYVLLEAMACGCVPVASRCGGADETVVEGETGFLTEIGDVDAMVRHIGLLVQDAPLRERLSAAARLHVRQNFNAPDQIGKLMMAYEEILSSPPPRAGSIAIDLLLQAATEIGYLGQHVTNMEERLKKAERAAALLLDNPVMKLLRHLKRAVK